MDIHTIEICAGVGMLGEGLRAGLAHLGGTLRTVAYVEREAYPAAVLAARCEEGSLDPAPIWSDLLTFPASHFLGAVDGIVAGFPCQDLSLAGKRAGLDGKRSGLFFDILDIADDCGAWFLFLENVSGISSATAAVVDETEGDLEERAASRVVGELAERGWHAEWLTVSASDVGASHRRERWFCFAWREALGDTGCVQRIPGYEQDRPECTKAVGIKENHWASYGSSQLANTDSEPAGRICRSACSKKDSFNEAGACNCDRSEDVCRNVADTFCKRSETRLPGSKQREERNTDWLINSGCSRPFFAPGPKSPEWAGIIQHWPELAPAIEPSFRGEPDGMAFAMDESRAQRLKCCGNGVVALQAAAAFVLLARRAGLSTTDFQYPSHNLNPAMRC